MLLIKVGHNDSPYSGVTKPDESENHPQIVACAAGGARDELKRLADIFRGQIVDVTPEQYTVQLVGTSEKLDAFIKTAAQTNEIIEVVRSGVCGISRADKSLRP